MTDAETMRQAVALMRQPHVAQDPFMAAVADLVENVRCDLHCNEAGMRDPYCSMCQDSTWDHECPHSIRCEHTVAYRNALKVCDAYLQEHR